MGWKECAALLMVFISCSARAGSVDERDAIECVTSLPGILEQKTAAVACDSSREPGVDCLAEAERYCENVKLSGGLIQSSTEKSSGASRNWNPDLSVAQRESLAALAGSRHRVPPAFKGNPRWVPQLEALDRHLRDEQKTPGWLEVLNTIQSGIWREVERTAKAAASSEGIDFEKAHDRVLGELTRAQYQDHPNWKRVERVFEMIRKDLERVVQENSGLPQETRDLLLARIKSVQLSLPTRIDSPEALSFFDQTSCLRDRDAGFYRWEADAVTVCAGMFNTRQTDDSLYFILAHEIGHALDLEALAYREYQTSEAAKVVAKLIDQDGPAYSCDEWKRIKREVLKSPNDFQYPRSLAAMRDFTLCLDANGDEGQKKRARSFREAMKENRAALDSFLSIGNLPDLTQRPRQFVGKIFQEHWEKKYQARIEAVPSRQMMEFFPHPFLYVQNLACQSGGGSAKAMEETKAQLNAIWNISSSFEPTGRSVKPPQKPRERGADWWGAKAFDLYQDRLATGHRRRKALYEAASVFCKQGSNWKAKVFGVPVLLGLALFDDYDLDHEHPSRNERMKGLLSGERGKKLGCGPTGAVSNSLGCQLGKEK